MSIYKDCDIRGIYKSELKAEDCFAIGRALATRAPGNIVVGGDLRLSTPELKRALIDGLSASGAHITDLGLISTPVLYFAQKYLNADAAATVTASHNPPEYNGIKFMIGDTPVTRKDIDEIRDIALSESFRNSEGASYCIKDIIPAYEDSLLRRFHASKPLHILVDAGNGCMSELAPRVLRSAGYHVTELFCTPDGSFPNRAPDPSNFKNLSAACIAVKECNADFGVAFDGDGDRAVFIDNTGEPIRNERALILYIRHLLSTEPTAVVYDQKASSAVKEAILNLGGTPVPERSGHAFIKHRFLELGAKVAGEVSGHFFFGELGYDDALFATLLMAELLSAQEKSIKTLANEIILPPATPDLRFACAYAKQQACLDAVEATAVANGAQISHLDGVRADFGGGWFLIRKSVTAEQITFRAEAQNEKRLREIVAVAASALDGDQKEHLMY